VSVESSQQYPGDGVKTFYECYPIVDVGEFSIGLGPGLQESKMRKHFRFPSSMWRSRQIFHATNLFRVQLKMGIYVVMTSLQAATFLGQTQRDPTRPSQVLAFGLGSKANGVG